MSEEDEYDLRSLKVVCFAFLIFPLMVFAFLGWLGHKEDMAKLKSTTTGEYRMTKKELLDSLKDLSDDAVIYVEAFSDDFDIDHTADYVEVKDIVSGNDVENEATIAAYF